MKKQKPSFRVRRIGGHPLKRLATSRQALAAFVAIVVLSSLVAYSDNPTLLAADTVNTTTLTAPSSTTYYRTTQTSPTSTTTNVRNLPPTAPDASATIQPIFSGANLQGSIFSQKPGDTTAEQNPVQVLDYMNVWGGLNAIGGIYSTNSRQIEMHNEVQADSGIVGMDGVRGFTPLLLNDNTNIQGDLTVGIPSAQGGGVDPTRGGMDVGFGTKTVRLDPTKFWNSDTYLRLGDRTFDSQTGTYGFDYNTNLGLNSIWAKDEIDANGSLRLGPDAYFRNGQNIAGKSASNRWIYLTDPAQTGDVYTHGIAMKQLWVNENGFIQGNLQVNGNIYNSTAGTAVTIADNLNVTGNITATGGVGRFYYKKNYASTTAAAVQGLSITNLQCDSGDTLVSCSGGLTTSNETGFFSGAYPFTDLAGTKSCNGGAFDNSTTRAYTLEVYAYCFSPDG